MNRLLPHNNSLRSLLESSSTEQLEDAVDLDSIDQVLRACLTIDEMREAGSFFTGQKLATSLIKTIEPTITESSIILDPTCGAGNLLIECSRQLKVQPTLSETLKLWGNTLWGFDIHEHFIEATKLRLALEAASRGAKIDIDLDDLKETLPNIRVQDAMLVNESQLLSVTHAVINPPFTIWPSPKKDYWNDGKVNAAGIVFDHLLRVLPEKSKISAILPDVIRSGSRYIGLRDFIASKLNAEVIIWGKFNTKTEVDVFIINGKKENKKNGVSWFKDLGEYKKISDLCDVSIGPLVAYRSPEEGPVLPYFHPKNCPTWGEITEPTEFRKFKGRMIESPFIVVKRTSSPSNKNRAMATIINIEQPSAVENHLIIIKPKTGGISACMKLLKKLMSEKTNNFLNERSRMRHLTVKTVKDIPL